MHRAAAAYVALSWLLIQIAETVLPAFGFRGPPGARRHRRPHDRLRSGAGPRVGLRADAGRSQARAEIDHRSARHSAPIALDRVIMGCWRSRSATSPSTSSCWRPAARAQPWSRRLRAEGAASALVESYGEKSIAVLPFVDMIGRQGPGIFLRRHLRGAAEPAGEDPAAAGDLALLGVLLQGQGPGDRARSRSELNVAHVLEGSVRKAGNQVRITAQLIEARSDTHLWSET